MKTIFLLLLGLVSLNVFAGPRERNAQDQNFEVYNRLAAYNIYVSAVSEVNETEVSTTESATAVATASRTNLQADLFSSLAGTPASDTFQSNTYTEAASSLSVTAEETEVRYNSDPSSNTSASSSMTIQQQARSSGR